MTFPATGMTASQVRMSLDSMAVNDRHFKKGRIFSLAYFAGADVYNVGRAAHDQFLGGNALNTDVFPSLREMQNDVLGAMADLFHGGDDSAGVMTSGGTESILCAVLGARELAHTSRPHITRPEIVLPTTAHAAFSKAAHYFGATTIRVPVGSDFRADPAAMRAAITPNTILIVGSAPSYPQGVIDPIEEIAALALEYTLPCHVDACMGGFVLPFMEQLGIDVRPWDFRVPGVTSISADNHKYGYAPKGASTLIYANRGLRKQQFFITTDWLGGLYGSQGLMGTRPGGPIAGAWAVMYHLGAEGYREHTQRSYDAARKLISAINGTPGVHVVGEPEATLVAWTSDPTAGGPVDIFAVGDALNRRDWFCDRQGPPDSLHCTVNSVHADVIDDFIADIAEAVLEVAGAPAEDRTAQYGTLDT